MSLSFVLFPAHRLRRSAVCGYGIDLLSNFFTVNNYDTLGVVGNATTLQVIGLTGLGSGLHALHTGNVEDDSLRRSIATELYVRQVSLAGGQRHVGGLAQYGRTVAVGNYPYATGGNVETFFTGSLQQVGRYVGNFYVNSGKQFAWYCRDNPQPNWAGDATGVAADSERRKITIDIPNRTVTLTTVTGAIAYTGTITYDCELTSTTTLRLFGNVTTNATGAAVLGRPASVRIFGAKIWNGNTLVRDYEPRLVDNVEGLYDTVNGTFNIANLSGAAAGNFRLTCGGNIISTSANGGSAAANADAYLQGTKSQGIQTDYYTSRKSRLEIDFSVTAFNGTDYFFGAVDTTRGNTNSVGLYYQLNNGNRNLSFRYWKGNGTNWPTINDGRATPARYKVVMDLPNAKGYWYADGALKRTIDLALPSSGDFKNTVPLRILSTQSDGNNCGYGRLYSFAIYEDNVLVHRYVPCVENGIAGVRDNLYVKPLKGSADLTPVIHRVLPDFYTRFMTPNAFWRMMDIKKSGE